MLCRLIEMLIKDKLCVLLVSALMSIPAVGANLDETFFLKYQEYSYAQYNLGLIHYEGRGVRQDYKKAFEWFTKAANQGDSGAQNILGVMYDNGQGVRQDHYKAKEWYIKAVNQGNAAAQVNLGLMYAKGQGVRQDYRKAKEWFGLSCDNGFQRGCDAYKDLNQGGF